MHTLADKVFYRELPHIIFHPDVFKFTLDVILYTTDDLCVCPGINDPALIDIAERKKTKFVTLC